MKITEEKLINTMVVTGYKCDICGKESKIDMDEISMRHTSWGNDSRESHTTSHVCSPRCFAKQCVLFVKNPDYSDNNSYIEDIHIDYIKALLEVKE